jgi:hypothetical protein
MFGIGGPGERHSRHCHDVRHLNAWYDEYGLKKLSDS